MSKETIYSEKALLESVAAGDEKAFRQMFDQYWDNIYGVAFLLTRSEPIVEDMVQEIFLKIWQKRHQLPSIDNFRNYLFIVARNHIFNELRRISRQPAYYDNLLPYTRDHVLSPEQQFFQKESEQLIRHAIGQLPDQQQAVYVLSRDEGLSHEEIALHLGISKNTVRNHMARALRSIRSYLQEHADGLLLLICLFNALLPII